MRRWGRQSNQRELSDATAIGITFQPASLTFTEGAVSSQLTGSFLITVTSTVAVGSYSFLSFAVSGASASEYSVAAAVKTIHVVLRAPAPVMASAIFSDSGGYVTVTFDSATDLAGTTSTSTSSWPCTSLLSFAGSSLTTCYWVDSASVRAVFGSYSTSTPYLVPGGNITLLADRLRPSCVSGNATYCAGDTYSSAATLIALSPTSPVAPRIVMSVASVVSSCANLTIDMSSSSGAGGRPWTDVRWSLSSAYTGATSNTTATTEYLNMNYGAGVSFGTALIVIPSS
jgi:hypothetical protein